MSALSAMQDKTQHLENSLSAETRIKLDLFSALGDAKRQLEIAQGLFFGVFQCLSHMAVCLLTQTPALFSACTQVRFFRRSRRLKSWSRRSRRSWLSCPASRTRPRLTTWPPSLHTTLPSLWTLVLPAWIPMPRYTSQWRSECLHAHLLSSIIRLKVQYANQRDGVVVLFIVPLLCSYDSVVNAVWKI